jgi:hypothetical protein
MWHMLLVGRYHPSPDQTLNVSFVRGFFEETKLVFIATFTLQTYKIIFNSRSQHFHTCMF